MDFDRKIIITYSRLQELIKYIDVKTGGMLYLCCTFVKFPYVYNLKVKDVLVCTWRDLLSEHLLVCGYH